MTDRATDLAPDAPAPAASGGGAERSRIFLARHEREIEVGAFRSEHGTVQRVRFDIEVDVPPPPPGDDVDAVLSYDVLLGAIDAALAAGRADLLETLAERIAAAVLAAPAALRVRVRIEKLDRVPGALGVEIVRTRPRLAGALPASPAPRIEGLGAGRAPAPGDGPAVLIAEAGEVAASGGDAADRQLRLLALDAAAWRAAAGTGLDVVETRTEMDHALGQGRAVLWAPRRMVLSAAAAPADLSSGALADWLAATLAPGTRGTA